jgi:ABC-2 type transport system permease protein
MSTTTATVSPHRANNPVNTATFAGNLKSEWIKLTTVRSTIWTLIILIASTLGFAVLTGGNMTKFPSYEITREVVVGSALGFISLTCLVVAVLGALFSAGEYGTGSIRSTMTATPRRLPVLWAKMVVLGLTTFVVGFGLAITAAECVAGGGDPVSFDPVVLGAACAVGAFLALTAIFALAIGFIVRNTAAAISIVVGVFFVMPLLVSALSHALKWLKDAAAYQFSASGSFMYSLGIDNPLMPWQATLVVLTWVAVASIIATIILKNKDA